MLLPSMLVGEYREDGARFFLEKHSNTKRGNGHKLQGRVLHQT